MWSSLTFLQRTGTSLIWVVFYWARGGIMPSHVQLLIRKFKLWTTNIFWVPTWLIDYLYTLDSWLTDWLTDSWRTYEWLITFSLLTGCWLNECWMTECWLLTPDWMLTDWLPLEYWLLTDWLPPDFWLLTDWPIIDSRLLMTPDWLTTSWLLTPDSWLPDLLPPDSWLLTPDSRLTTLSIRTKKAGTWIRKHLILYNLAVL